MVEGSSCWRLFQELPHAPKLGSLSWWHKCFDLPFPSFLSPSRFQLTNMSSVGIRQKDDLLICPSQWNDFKFCPEPSMNTWYILFLCFSLSHEINTPPYRRQLYLFLSSLRVCFQPQPKVLCLLLALGLFPILNFSFLTMANGSVLLPLWGP